MLQQGTGLVNKCARTEEAARYEKALIDNRLARALTEKVSRLGGKSLRGADQFLLNPCDAEWLRNKACCSRIQRIDLASWAYCGRNDENLHSLSPLCADTADEVYPVFLAKPKIDDRHPRVGAKRTHRVRDRAANSDVITAVFFNN